MFNWFKNLVTKKKYEYLYFYILGSDLFGIEIRQEIFKVIANDLKEINKEIEDFDFYTNTETYESVTILTTFNKKAALYRPLLFEIYAFMKQNKNINIISYPFTELTYLYKEVNKPNKPITILKFKIEC